jgi:hypothetical protein
MKKDRKLIKNELKNSFNTADSKNPPEAGFLIKLTVTQNLN